MAARAASCRCAATGVLSLILTPRIDIHLYIHSNCKHTHERRYTLTLPVTQTHGDRQINKHTIAFRTFNSPWQAWTLQEIINPLPLSHLSLSQPLLLLTCPTPTTPTLLMRQLPSRRGRCRRPENCFLLQKCFMCIIFPFCRLLAAILVFSLSVGLSAVMSCLLHPAEEYSR